MDLRAQVIVTHSQWDEQLNSDPRGTTTKRNICYIWDSGSKRVSDFLLKRTLFNYPFLELCSSYQISRLFIKLVLSPPPSAAQKQRTQAAAAFQGNKRHLSAPKKKPLFFLSKYLLSRKQRSSQTRSLPLCHMHSSKLRTQRRSLWSFAIKV